MEQQSRMATIPYAKQNLDPISPERAAKYAAGRRRKLRLAWSAGKLSPVADPDGWVKPCPHAAFHGLAGEFVALVAPQSEADPVALLVQFLVCFGNIVERNLYRNAESARHYPNLFAVLVGKSSKSRKGSSFAQVKRLFERVDPEWCERCILNGLATGEGLIHAVRDGGRENAAAGEKRALVIEAEFARVLKVAERKENTLSPVLRDAWDTGDLNVLTKTSPARTRGAHISIIGHITRDELIRNLNLTEIANGFANRFLWLAVRRSKSLPFGGSLDVKHLDALAETVKMAVEYARTAKAEIGFSEEARDTWTAIYEPLSDDREGLVGAIVSRAEAQVLRLACLYAALDRSRVIQPGHLDAALALWDYCERSALFIFGNSLGDSIADTILVALRNQTGNGLTRTNISGLFGRNMDNAKIQKALDTLREKHLATCTKEKTDGGRPVERWKVAREIAQGFFRNS